MLRARKVVCARVVGVCMAVVSLRMLCLVPRGVFWNLL